MDNVGVGIYDVSAQRLGFLSYHFCYFLLRKQRL